MYVYGCIHTICVVWKGEYVPREYSTMYVCFACVVCITHHQSVYIYYILWYIVCNVCITHHQSVYIYYILWYIVCNVCITHHQSVYMYPGIYIVCNVCMPIIIVPPMSGYSLHFPLGRKERSGKQASIHQTIHHDPMT